MPTHYEKQRRERNRLERDRAAAERAAAMRFTPCHECGCGNESTEPVASCRLCGAVLGAARFTWQGGGSPDLNPTARPWD